MLSNVSWGQFLGSIAVLLVIYYLFMAVYLKKDTAAFLSKLRKKSSSPGEGAPAEKLTVDQLETIVGELRVKVFRPLGHDATREEIFSLLRTQLTGYPGISNKAYRYALGNAIIQLSAEMCGVEIDEQDLNTLWNTI